jgi:broad specificity phosphatase PhoE
MIRRLFFAFLFLFMTAAQAHTYQDEEVAFVLPGEWQKETDPSAWVIFRSEKEQAQFIVAIVRIKESMPSYEARLRIVEQMADIRREQMNRLSSGAVVFSEPTITQVKDQLIYEFFATSMAPKVQICIHLIQRQNKLASFSLFEYGGRPQPEFLKFAHLAFSSATLK